MAGEIILETKFVGEIEGKFLIPSYQRGYRWSKVEVERLLEDIYNNGDKSYFLQPIVVKNGEDKYELIDGQQRLTTIYLIYQYMHKESPESITAPKFTLSYTTREKSQRFLEKIDKSENEAKDNIDFWYMWKAYECIEDWFDKKDKDSIVTNMNEYFRKNVKVIWYEVDESEDSINLFTRLNIGKIPLTNAELVKALFLSTKGIYAEDKSKQLEIALQWDIMEKELHNDSFWFFLTNSSDTDYQTRIDLVLDLMDRNSDKKQDKYATFFYFLDEKNKISFDKIWWTFLILKAWYEDHDLYHKIGYLIASGDKRLKDIFEASKNRTKSEFKKALDESISDSINLKKYLQKKENYSDLSYQEKNEKKMMARLLLLFNIESVRLYDGKSQRFPFDKYKWDDTCGKVIWSLEHIHAQNSEGFRSKEMWKEWFENHLKSIESIGSVAVKSTESVSGEKIEDERKQGLIARINEAIEIAKKKLDMTVFDKLSKEVIVYLSIDDNIEYLHSISNMALLNTAHNAALNNSTFDVKRNILLGKDKGADKSKDEDKVGEYIPLCTRRVFLKYYTPSEKNQIHFWGIEDRNAYIDAINDVLKKYLRKENLLIKEGN